MKKLMVIFCCLITVVVACKQNPKKVSKIHGPKPKTIGFTLENAKTWLPAHSADKNHLQIACAVNRTDSVHFSAMDTVIIPVDLNGDIVYYLPFPLEVPFLKDIDKIIFFSYPTQVFAAYENGFLIYTGPTNMGKRANQTPTGLYYSNWKAEKTVSTFDDEWDLYWNFNVENKEGIGWHQYALPGYPASHSCLRLQEKDAIYLYNWADEWKLSKTDIVEVKGTPTVVFGTYNFDAPKPWLQLVSSPTSLDISPKEIEQITKPYLKDILSNQTLRRAL